MQELIEASGAKLISFPLCLLGHDAQKHVTLVVWPAESAAKFDHLHGQECPHLSHAKHATGEDADGSKVYPPAFDKLIAQAHLDAHVARDVNLGVLAAMPPASANHIRMLSDNGATDAFVRTDEHCVPGTDAAPTIASVVVGNAQTRLMPEKSCVLPLKLPRTGRIIMPRVNVADVPMPIMSEGLLMDEYNATFTRSAREAWTCTFPPDDVINISPGPGRLARLGFMTFEVAPVEAAFLMLPVSNTTNVDMMPDVQWLDDEPEDGVLMLSAHTPTHVHMPKPSPSTRPRRTMLDTWLSSWATRSWRCSCGRWRR